MNTTTSLDSENQKMAQKTSKSLKLTYTTPKLIEHGNVSRITLGSGSGSFDGGTFGRVPS